jgi:hypothetical protein
MHSARLVGKQEVILVRISASSRGPQTGSGDINGDFPQEDFWPGQLPDSALSTQSAIV